MGASIKASCLWWSVHRLTLSTNIRVQLGGDNPAVTFPNQLLQLGNGSLPSKPGTNLVTLTFGTCVGDKQELIANVFPNVIENHLTAAWLRGSTIIAPKNIMVDQVNDQMLLLWSGEPKSYSSVDCAVDPDDVINYPTEFLHSLKPPCNLLTNKS